jgi:hypothetical protein
MVGEGRGCRGDGGAFMVRLLINMEYSRISSYFVLPLSKTIKDRAFAHPVFYRFVLLNSLDFPSPFA